MSEDPDRLWERLAPKYRKYKGLCSETREGAEAAYDAAPNTPLPSRTIREMVERITAEPDEPEEPAAWQDSVETAELCAMYRDEGEKDPDTDEIEAELRKQMLDGENKDGVSGGGAAPSPGR